MPKPSLTTALGPSTDLNVTNINSSIGGDGMGFVTAANPTNGSTLPARAFRQTIGSPITGPTTLLANGRYAGVGTNCKGDALFAIFARTPDGKIYFVDFDSGNPACGSTPTPSPSASPTPSGSGIDAAGREAFKGKLADVLAALKKIKKSSKPAKIKAVKDALAAANDILNSLNGQLVSDLSKDQSIADFEILSKAIKKGTKIKSEKFKKNKSKAIEGIETLTTTLQ